ncbi:MAG: hypothetical protein CML04_06755 [Pseudozobellia sp.]|nr:hypothetical protein [Pseudozobellia sp.]MBG50045.1 hypothetical protein [Pseudozobellia sp.]|tara:strand:- start:4214 stop:4630 length:417 start_codon:yes stop_codon:yes gene_type:complete
MKTTKLYYRIALSIFSVAMVYAVANSFINYDTIAIKFQQLGYPTYLISVLGAAQMIGLAVLIINKNNWLREWAYAGFFLNFIFGIIAHLMAKEGNGAAAVVCIIVLWVAYVQNKKLSEQTTEEDNIEKIKIRTLRKVI